MKANRKISLCVALLCASFVMAQNPSADARLKIRAARNAGIDTTAVFQRRVQDYEQQLAKEVLIDDVLLGATSGQDALYSRMQGNGTVLQLKVCQIFKKLPQHAAKAEIGACQVLMDSIARQLDAGTPFAELMHRYSDRRDTLQLNRLQVTADFEENVFALPAGQWSKPFWTSEGVHIVKVLEEGRLTPDAFRRQLASNMRAAVPQSLITRRTADLKRDYAFAQNQPEVDRLLRDGVATGTLFTLDGKAYTGSDFARFAAAFPAGVRRQYDEFVQKAVFDCHNGHLTAIDDVLKLRVAAYADKLLEEEMTERMVLAPSRDEAALHAYFDKHRKDYVWPVPRFRGLIVHAVNKKTAKKVRKVLGKLPESERFNAARLLFSEAEKQRFCVEEGVYVLGQNAYVDDQEFGGPKVSPPQGYAFTLTLGRKLQGPEDYREVHDRVQADYQKQLERDWLDKLRSRN